MALNKIKTGSITDDAVNSDKLAAGSVTNTELNKTAITGQTELSETANDADFTLIFDTSANALKKVLRSNIIQGAPVFTAVSPTNVDTGVGSTTSLVITGTGFTAGSNARLVDNSGKIVEFTTVTRNSAVQLTCVATHSALDTTQSPYDIQITNGEGISILSANQLDVNAAPIFITSAGSLGTGTEGTSFSADIVAQDPDSTSVVSYELQSGALPTGLSLTSLSGDVGRISGTLPSVAANTTFNFVIRATDSASNTTSRAFSITVNNVLFQIFTSSGTFNVPTGVSSVDLLAVAGGGGGGNDGGGGGGAGGLVFIPGFSVTPGGTVSVTVGCGGAGGDGGPQAGKRGTTGQDSVFGTITAKGGGGGGGGDCFQAGNPGGSGGGGGGNIGGGDCAGGGSAIQSPQSGQSGAYGFGNAGGDGQRPGNLIQLSGGGGGAAAAGQSGTGGSGGGAGKAYTIADGTTSVYYAGGGAGSRGNPIPTWQPASGGQGGGGNNGAPSGAQAGQANKGGGGGGPSASSQSSLAPGGKGVVIVRWT